MHEPSEHERVIELLKRIRRPDAEITPERREENLRWLVRLARPKAQASEALRERVRAIVTAPPRHRASIRERLFPAAVGRRRRALVGGVVLAIASVLLVLLLAPRAPAQVLARTLAAMARVRSAHCTGWHIAYRTRGKQDRRVSTQFKVDWWYKAPGWYRKAMSPTHPGRDRSAVPLLLTIRGNQDVLVSKAPNSPGRRITLPPAVLTRYLSPLDFFTPHGFLHRAQAEKAAQVTEGKTRYHDRPVQRVEVEAIERQPEGTCRQHWILDVDPISDRILRSEWSLDCQPPGGAWRTLEREALDDFTYDLPVNDRLFKIARSPLAEQRGRQP